VSGLEVPSQRNLKLLPYVLGEVQTEGGETSTRSENFEFGIDLKYSITPSLTLDATYNTDFAQVEADDFQINLNRFNLFFPEKRPFFLENAGYFSVGVPQEVELFFSRRIGIGPDGEVVPIIAGARTSGKLAGKYNLGALYMRTEAVPGVTPENGFAVARLSRDLPNRSYIGGIVVSRQAYGFPGSDEDSNHTFSLDGRLGIGEYGLLQGFVAKTETPGAEEGEYAFRLGGNYDSERWSYSASYTEVADDFNPEVGFLTRRGYRKPSFFVMRRIRPKDLIGLLEIRPHASYNGYWDFDGFQETGFLHLDTHWEWRSSYEVHTGINFTREGVKEAFEIYPDIWVSPGTYDNVEAQIVFYTNRGAPVSFSFRSFIGGFFGGDRVSFAPNLRVRFGETFNAELGWSFNDIDLPEGAFRANLGRLRLSYSFTTQINLQALIQYIFNQNQDIHSSGFGWTRTDRSLIVKYSYLFDLLK
jgi:hypothetical protein